MISARRCAPFRWRAPRITLVSARLRQPCRRPGPRGPTGPARKRSGARSCSRGWRSGTRFSRNWGRVEPQGMGEAVIIGAGPAGLTAAYCLCEAGWKATVFEADPEYVGGISRTVVYKGFRFDIGGHRFFSKSQEVEDFWSIILGDDLIQRPRLSRIYYRGQLYSYPLKPFEALWKLGLAESALCVLSYIKARLFPIGDPKSFEDWVTNQFDAGPTDLTKLCIELAARMIFLGKK